MVEFEEFSSVLVNLETKRKSETHLYHKIDQNMEMIGKNAPHMN